MGPAPPPRKENYATETCTTNENNTSVLEEAGPALLTRTYDVLRRKPKVSHNANDPSFDQENFEHRHLERANNVRSVKKLPRLQQKCGDLTSPYKGSAKPDGPSQDNCC